MNIDNIINSNHKNELKIYPVVEGFGFKIEVEHLGKKKKGSLRFTTATINKGLIDTHIYYFEKLKTT